MKDTSLRPKYPIASQFEVGNSQPPDIFPQQMDAPNDTVFEDFSGCLIVRVFGRAIIEDKDTVFRSMAVAIRTRSPKAVLVDMRGIAGKLTFMDRFQLGEAAGKHLAGLHLAVLALPEQADEKQIGVLVARNRGARIEALFTEEAAAMAWLKKWTA